MSQDKPNNLGPQLNIAMNEFFQELAADASPTIDQAPESPSPIEEAPQEKTVADGFVRLADFLKKKNEHKQKRGPRDKISIALSAYTKQKAALP